MNSQWVDPGRPPSAEACLGEEGVGRRKTVAPTFEDSWSRAETDILCGKGDI